MDDAWDVLRFTENSTDVAGAGGRFRKFTQSNFRENLARFTGKKPKDFEAHHVLPQKFKDSFAGVGINIHEPKFGSWVEADAHRKWSHSYNQQWEGFFDSFGRQDAAPTREQIFEFAEHLAVEYNFDVYFTTP
jgi:hypothetical protein